MRSSITPIAAADSTTASCVNIQCEVCIIHVWCFAAVLLVWLTWAAIGCSRCSDPVVVNLIGYCTHTQVARAHRHIVFMWSTTLVWYQAGYYMQNHISYHSFWLSVDLVTSVCCYFFDAVTHHNCLQLNCMHWCIMCSMTTTQPTWLCLAQPTGYVNNIVNTSC